MSRNDPEGSFVRWQSLTIAQLTYAINLILGLSVAALGFQITLLINERFNPVSWQKCVFFLSLLILLLSVGFGIWCVINRLRDFRVTTKVARMCEQGKSEEEMQPYRVLYKRLERGTWVLFWCQVTTFGLGIFLLVLGVIGSVSEKLF
jgi:hypothetical protein